MLSYDQENPTDVLAALGASAALHCSSIPWAGPIGSLRVARVDGRFVANPTFAEMERGDLDLVIAASKDAIVMVEGEGSEVSEEDLVDALFYGKDAIKPAIELIEEMARAVGNKKWTFTPPAKTAGLADRVAAVSTPGAKAACNVADKHARGAAFKATRKEMLATLLPELGTDKEKEIKEAYEDVKYVTMREQVLSDPPGQTSRRPLRLSRARALQAILYCQRWARSGQKSERQVWASVFAEV